MKSKRVESGPIKLSRGNVKPRVVRHEVRDEIQRRILSGENKPGERLSQQSLARELGVAQGTVREALLELQWLGLVESVDHLGVFVENSMGRESAKLTWCARRWKAWLLD